MKRNDRLINLSKDQSIDVSLLVRIDQKNLNNSIQRQAVPGTVIGNSASIRHLVLEYAEGTQSVK